MLLLLLSLAVLSVHGQNTNDQDDALRKQVEALTESMEKIRAGNAAIKHDIQKIQQSKLIDPPICFSAVKTSTQSVSSGDIILFDEELVDTHDTYNPIFGIYIIPEAGLYEVTVTLYKGTSSTYDDMTADLYVGDTFLTQIYNDYTVDSSASAHSTSSIIREFEVGNTLRVEASSSGSFYGSTSYKASQFSAKYVGPAPSAK